MVRNGWLLHNRVGAIASDNREVGPSLAMAGHDQPVVHQRGRHAMEGDALAEDW
jgi:hypothetical protein